MAVLAIAAAGAWAGSAALGAGAVLWGMSGAQLGWMAGSMLGNALFAPTQRGEGPRLGDLQVSGSAYGTPIPSIAGHPRVAGQVIWASTKREIATTQSAGGKGGGGSEYTTYTYEVDLLILLSDNEIASVRRIWKNGEMIWTQAADATQASRNASVRTGEWSRLTVYGGSPPQLPDPDYEAAVGTANAPAYRGRGTVFIKSLQLGGSGQMPNLTFEVMDAGMETMVLAASGTAASSWSSSATTQVVVNGGRAYQVNTNALYVFDVMDPETPVQIASFAPGAGTSLGIAGTTVFSVSSTGLRAIGCSASPTTLGTTTLLETAYQIVVDGAYAYLGGNGGGGPRKLQIINVSNPASMAAVGLLTLNNACYALAKYGSYLYSASLYSAGSIAGIEIINVANPAAPGVSATLMTAAYLNSLAIVGSTLYALHGSKWLKIYSLTTPTAPELLGSYDLSSTTGSPVCVAVAGKYAYITYSSTAKIQALDVSNPASVVDFGWISTGGITGESLAPASGYVLSVSVSSGVLSSYHVVSTGWTVSDLTIESAVTQICLTAGLQPSQFDATSLATITRPVRAMAISQVSSARTVLEMLASMYQFESVLSDKIYFVPRGSAPVATITFDELGVMQDSTNPPDPLPLMQANELEIPAQLALTYSNVDGDYQTDTQYSDRLLTGMESTSATQVPMGFTPSEAKQIADTLLMDKAVSALSTTITLDTSRAALQPTDVILLTGEDTSSYRMRIVKRTDAGGVTTLQCVGDDASILTQAGTTIGGTTSQTTVAALATTALQLLDIPLLRDVDNLPGFYVAVTSGATNWSNCAIYDSLDDLTYSQTLTMGDQTALGTCTTTLGNWTGGNTFDEANTVTVNVGAIQQLVSVTRDDILANQGINSALIGSELVQYRTATLVSAGVYTLSGFLRGRRGTEWAQTGHASGERFVALGTSGLRFVALQAGDLGHQRYYKAASAGQKLSAVTSQAITPAGVALECFSPVNARADRTTTDTVLTWTRRTRLSTRLVGTLPISAPLGEVTEAYEVEVWDSTYTTLKRTLSASTPSVTYTSSQQVTDFGSNQATLYLKIYQLSATVGRGYPLTVSI
jgi:hypothetical protein